MAESYKRILKKKQDFFLSPDTFSTTEQQDSNVELEPTDISNTQKTPSLEQLLIKKDNCKPTTSKTQVTPSLEVQSDCLLTKRDLTKDDNNCTNDVSEISSPERLLSNPADDVSGSSDQNVTVSNPQTTCGPVHGEITTNELAKNPISSTPSIVNATVIPSIPSPPEREIGAGECARTPVSCVPAVTSPSDHSSTSGVARVINKATNALTKKYVKKSKSCVPVSASHIESVVTITSPEDTPVSECVETSNPVINTNSCNNTLSSSKCDKSSGPVSKTPSSCGDSLGNECERNSNSVVKASSIEATLLLESAQNVTFSPHSSAILCLEVCAYVLN